MVYVWFVKELVLFGQYKSTLLILVIVSLQILVILGTCSYKNTIYLGNTMNQVIFILSRFSFELIWSFYILKFIFPICNQYNH